MPISKNNSYWDLLNKRKGCSKCNSPALCNPSKYKNGVYDKDELGPWSHWHGHLYAEVIVIGQVWGSVNDFKKTKGENLQGNSMSANYRLIDLLAPLGFKITRMPNKDDILEKDCDNKLFFTNALLCLTDKQIDPKWLNKCASEYLKELIENTVKPHVVIALGKDAYCAMKWIYTPEIEHAIKDALKKLSEDNMDIPRLKNGKINEYKVLINYKEAIPINSTTDFFVVPHPSGKNKEYNIVKNSVEKIHLPIWMKVKKSLDYKRNHSENRN